MSLGLGFGLGGAAEEAGDLAEDEGAGAGPAGGGAAPRVLVRHLLGERLLGQLPLQRPHVPLVLPVRPLVI